MYSSICRDGRRTLRNALMRRCVCGPAHVPLKSAHSHRGPGTPIHHGSLDPRDLSQPQTASQSVQPFLQSSPVCQTPTQTDTQTTLRATSVAIAASTLCVERCGLNLTIGTKTTSGRAKRALRSCSMRHSLGQSMAITPGEHLHRAVNQTSPRALSPTKACPRRIQATVVNRHIHTRWSSRSMLL